MKYGQLSLDEVEAVLNNVGGMDAVNRLLSGLTSISMVWKTWKTIQLGYGQKTVSDLADAIKQAGMGIGEFGDTLPDASNFSISTENVEVDLVIVSVGELGLEKGAIQKDVFARAQKLGLDICPSEVGFRLRLQYDNQPEGEWIAIAMEPIYWAKFFSVFYLSTQGARKIRWLVAEVGGPDKFWNADSRLVFMRRK